jgi:hypothetical protein
VRTSQDARGNNAKGQLHYTMRSKKTELRSDPIPFRPRLAHGVTTHGSQDAWKPDYRGLLPPCVKQDLKTNAYLGQAGEVTPSWAPPSPPTWGLGHDTGIAKRGLRRGLRFEVDNARRPGRGEGSEKYS